MSFTQFYQPGVPEQIELPTDSLVDLLETSVQQGGRRVALEFFGRETTYRELGDQIHRAAQGLLELGVKPGDRVALVLPNCPQHVVAFYAVLRLGAIVVEHNPLYTARELRHMFEDHTARVAICWDKAVANLRDQPHDIELDHIVSVNLLEAFPAVKRLALRLPLPSLRRTRKQLTAPTKNTISWSQLLNRPPLNPATPLPDVHDTAVIQYTSGTTGQPKGALLSHYNLYANARQGEAWMHGAQYRKETFYAVLPMFHAFGMTLYLTYGILKQARLVLFPNFDVNQVLAAAKKHPPTVFCAVPPIFETTAAQAQARNISLKTAAYCISGAMALPDKTVSLWESVSGGLLVEGYGLTEASPVALGNPFYSTRRRGTIGLPFPSTEIRVVDPDDPTQEVTPGQRGELLIRGPQVFRGYWNNPEATAQILLPGGWLRSGDIVTQDADGFTTIVDRLKELIITGGFNVAPSEVEQVLQLHPDIAESAVIGLPDEHSGEMVVAVVVPKPGSVIDDDQVRDFCRTRLARYKVPRRVIVVASLPKSMLGKVLRRQVRADLLQTCRT
ncbi:MAG: AMP-binding protein [Propionibacteriaceae bacterium]|jgi:long-chain acyl-CoA synthetase|nr:AMP-binding protein [Propionibacteriaceae bacterium]